MDRMKSKAKSPNDVSQYTHGSEKRTNNPQVGLVTPGTDPDQPSKKYSYDPRLDPQLLWSGKRESTEFEVDTVSLHVHERIDPLTILEKVMKPQQDTQQTLFNYFDTPENNPALRDAVDFYKHNQGWSNRLIAGDSLLVMNSLLEKEGMEGKVQMIYMDPPYGIKYGSNFQPFVSKQNVRDGNDGDLTQEPEMIRAFRDTWELGIHSYLSYLRDRLLLSKQLLSNSGSIFIQISEENLHHVHEIMTEVFGHDNFVSMISYRTTAGDTTSLLPSMADYIVWFAKDKSQIKFHKIFVDKELGVGTGAMYNHVESPSGEIRRLTNREILNPKLIPKGWRVFSIDNLKRGGFSKTATFEFEFDGKKFHPGNEHQWKTNQRGMEKLKQANWLIAVKNTLRYKRYFDDFPISELGNIWIHTQGATNKRYVVQTSPKIIQRCMLMTTDPADLVLDPTCGGGTTAYVAEQWGRRWMTCDTSRISIAIAKSRLMTAEFSYYKMINELEGLQSGFKYRTVLHKTLRTVVNDDPPLNEILYDQPIVQMNKKRISGPFTVEAVPSPIARSVDVLSEEYLNTDNVSLQTASYQQQWRDELQKTGIRGKGKQRIEFIRIEPHPTTKWLHANAEMKDIKPKRVMISFGPKHAPLEQRQVALALEEAQTIIPKPEIIIFASMQFDPEAAKDIDGIKWPDVTILKAVMNKDLLTQDLKSERSSNESFWLVGQPDVELQKTNNKYIIKMNGFDYYNTKTKKIESGGSSKIAMWMLDTDYDGRSVYPQQVFFPMDKKTGGWNRLAKTLQAQLDEELITKYQGTESIPFEAGPNKRAAVKIIDDRGIESLKIILLE